MRSIFAVSALSFILPFIATSTDYVHQKNCIIQSTECFNKENYSQVSFSEVDAFADRYVPPYRIFNHEQTIEIKNKLDAEAANPSTNEIGIDWAYARFYAGASSFVGGSTAQALVYAGYMYSLNKYVGCLAYEFIYKKMGQAETAKHWYEQSLTIVPPQNMSWQIIKFSNNVLSDIQVKGNFSNWKLQGMYKEEKGNDFIRKIMTPKCENCQYEIFVDFKKEYLPSEIEETKRIY